MTYAANLACESVESRFFVVIKPRTILSSWTLDSGSVYYCTAPQTSIVGVSENGSDLALGTGHGLSAGQWYYDSSNGRLYLRTAGSSDPSAKTIVATFELYAGTFAAYLNRIPTDSVSETVYFEAYISSVPAIKSMMSEMLYGAVPIQSSNMELINADGFFDQFIYAGSLNLADCDIYQCVGKITPTNFKLVYTGVISDSTLDDKRLSLSLLDRMAILDKGFDGQIYTASSGFGATDPRYVGRPIQMIYGCVEGVRGVCLDSGTTNYVYCFGQESARPSKGAGVYGQDGLPGGTNTTTRTYINCAGVRVGDRVEISNRHFPTAATRSEYVEVTGVYLSPDWRISPSYIDHTAMGSPWPDTTGYLFVCPVARVSIVMDGTKYEAYPGRDFYVNNSGAYVLIFISGYITNIGLPRGLGPNDTVYSRVYGSSTLPTIGGVSFGASDASYGSIVNPIVILYDIMKRLLGIPETSIDTTTFLSLASSITSPVSFASPEMSNGSFPKIIEMLGLILGSCLLRLYLDDQNRWTLAPVLPMTSTSDTISDDEIEAGSLGFEFKYGEIISDVIVEYGAREISDNVNEYTGEPLRAYSTNTNAKYLHKISQQKTFKSVFSEKADAQKLADRLSYIFGERRGIVKFNLPAKKLGTLISENILLERTRLPGFSSDGVTLNTRKVSVIDIEKKAEAITVICDDQKGIQDNLGSW